MPADADNRLAGQVVAITGASRGIGRAIAHRLGRLGAVLSLCARHPQSLEEAAATLRRDGITVLAMAADVTQAEQVERWLTTTRKELGEIDVLINNAGVGWFGPVHQATESDWDRLLDTNLKGAFLTIRTVAPWMIARRRGVIVNIASLAAKNAFAGGALYCASKWGLLGFSQAAAEDLRAYGIRVSVICPGSVATEFSPHTGRDPAKMLTPEDVAYTVEMVLQARPESFVSEVLLRPTQKP